MHGSLWLVKRHDWEGFVEKDGKVWEDKSDPICSALSEEVCGMDLRRWPTIPESELPHDPRDKNCLVRPAVVWFGECLDETTLQRATSAVQSADVFLVCGTSSVVYPAAGFASEVHRNGGCVAEFNLEETPNSAYVSEGMGFCTPGGSCAKLLPEALDDLF